MSHMSQKTKKTIGVLGTVAVILIIAAFAVMLTMKSSTNADQMDLITVHGDGLLKSGKYYIDGDNGKYYYEVFDDRTIQLKGGDILEFVIMRDGRNLKPDDELYPEYYESVKQTAEWLSTRKDYIVVDLNYPNGGKITRVFFEKSTEDIQKNQGGFCLNYIDEKTFEQYYTFTRAE